MRMLQSEAMRVTGLLILAAGWKLVFLLTGQVPFNADEAVVALMARHIMQGQRPVFFYGQVYMGSLDAWLVAGGFAIFGEQIWVIRTIQTLLYLGVVMCGYHLARMLFSSARAGLLAGLLLAAPAVNTTLYTTASLGGYGEALLLGALMLLVVFKIAQTPASARTQLWLAGLWALLAGIGWWANGLSLVFSVPTGVYLLWMIGRDAAFRGRRLLALGMMPAGILVGGAPWWVHAVVTGPNHLLAELLGSAVAVERTPLIVTAASHLVNMLLLGIPALLGLRPPWEVRWLVLPLLPVILFFWIAVAFYAYKSAWLHRPQAWVLLGVCGMVVAGFVFTPFGIDPSGRYFLPLILPLTLAAAGFLTRFKDAPVRPYALLGIVLLYHMLGTLQAASTSPTGLTTQFFAPSVVDHHYDEELIAFLTAEGETRGYSTYWVAYPLAFQSGEKILFVPALPYHPDLRYTPRDNRYPPYQQAVSASQKVAYIGSIHNPGLSETLRVGFSTHGLTWSERIIGDFVVFYRLSGLLRPEEIGFGMAREAVE